MILPGQTIGVLGSGQLGRMFAFAAHRMGYHVHIFSPDRNTPAGQAADRETAADYDDKNALRQFAGDVDVVTVEFENIPLEALDTIADIVPVRPGRTAFAQTRNRIAEKTMLANMGFPVPDFSPVIAEDDIAAFFDRDTPHRQAVIKTAEFGYDGKGQSLIDGLDTAMKAFAELGGCPAVIEEYIDLDCELSVIGARAVDGEVRCFGPILNQHEHHILDVSTAPGESIPAGVAAETIKITHALLEQLDVCGVIGVEFFLDRRGRLLINEIAPRTHNSGHLTIEASVTSQFEQQLRAICGLPLGSMEQIRPAAMANLLGEHFACPNPDWRRVMNHPNLHLHLYGKAECRNGRKMGHLTATASSTADAEAIVRSARKALSLPDTASIGNCQADV